MKEKLKKFIKKHGTTIYIGVSGVVISVVAYKMGNKDCCKKSDAGMYLVSKIGLIKFFDFDGKELEMSEASKYFREHFNEINEAIKDKVH